MTKTKDASSAKVLLFEDIRNQLLEELVGIEITLLVSAVPEVGQILHDKNHTTRNKNNPSGVVTLENTTTQYAYERADDAVVQGNDNNNKELLERSIVKFIQVISRHCSPLVLAFDDLQRADSGTLELLKACLLPAKTQQQHLTDDDMVVPDNNRNNKFMVIGCYRSNEVNESHLLSKWVRDLSAEKTSTTPLLRVTPIVVGALGIAETNQVLMGLLSIDEERKTLPLAELCHRRTMGNAFFLLAFVDMLVQQGLLKFHLGLFTWTWEETIIEQKTAATDNVVDLVKSKINQCCSPHLIELLKMASCLGTIFDKSLLAFVVQNHHGTSYSNDDQESTSIEALLETAVQEKFFEVVSCSDGWYRWGHDKIHEATILLESAHAFQERQRHVGTVLMKQLEGEEALEEAVFTIANLLHQGGAEPSTEIARINLLAAKKAKKVSAFECQERFARIGIYNLPVDPWAPGSKELALELHSIAAEATCCLGHFDVMDEHCEIVLEQSPSTVTALDKLRCYIALEDSLNRRG